MRLKVYTWLQSSRNHAQSNHMHFLQKMLLCFILHPSTNCRSVIVCCIMRSSTNCRDKNNLIFQVRNSEVFVLFLFQPGLFCSTEKEEEDPSGKARSMSQVFSMLTGSHRDHHCLTVNSSCVHCYTITCSPHLSFSLSLNLGTIL